MLPSWAAGEAAFDEHGLSEPSPYEPPGGDEESPAAVAVDEVGSDVEGTLEDEDSLVEEPEVAPAAELEVGEDGEEEEYADEEDTEEEGGADAHAEDGEEWEYEEEEEYEEDDEEVGAEAALSAEASWEGTSPEAVDPLPAGGPAAEIDARATNGSVQPLEEQDAPQSPGWEAGEPSEVEPVAGTGAPPAHGVRQESLFEEVDLDEEDALLQASGAAVEVEEGAPAEAAKGEHKQILGPTLLMSDIRGADRV